MCWCQKKKWRIKCYQTTTIIYLRRACLFFGQEDILKIILLSKTALYGNSWRNWNHRIWINFITNKKNLNWRFWFSWFCFFFQHNRIEQVDWIRECLDQHVCWMGCNKLQNLINLQKMKHIWDQVLLR